MDENNKLVLVYTTYPSASSAQSVAELLVKDRLAACVNVLPTMTAVYEWDGQLQKDQEAVCLVKTRSELSAQVMTVIKDNHPYDTPALFVLPIQASEPDYTAWVVRQTAHE